MVERRWPIALLIVAMGFGAWRVAAGPTGQMPPEDGPFRLRLLDLRVDSVCRDRVARLLQGPEGGLFASRETLAGWGLVVPPVAPLRHDGRNYYPVNALPDIEARVDETRQVLVLETTSAECFQPVTMSVSASDSPSPQPPPTGGFLNYDALYQGGDIRRTARALLEMGLYNRWGTGTSTVLAHRTGEAREAVRLETAWRHDWPGRMQTLVLGDTRSRTGSWGRSVRYGGIQWGTNFDTHPGYISQPLPRISGEATVPSTVELYTNNMQRLQGELPPGPFTLQEIPAVTGVNEVRLVMEDVLGRERTIRQPFYLGRSLLKAGLHDFTYEAGAIRQDYSRRSNEYGRAFASATHRLGLSRRLTGEVRAELLKDQRTLGLSGAWLPAHWLGVVNGAVAASSGETGEGMLFSAGMDRQGRRWSYGVRATWSDRDFRQLGLQPGRPAPARVVTASAGGRLAARLSLSLTYSELARRDWPDNRLVNASLSTRLGGKLALRASLLYDLEQREEVASLTLSLPLGNRTSVSASHRQEERGHRSRVQVQRNPPRGSGMGYRFSSEVASAGRDRHLAQLDARTAIGSYRIQAERFGEANRYRLNARGGIAFLGGRAHVSRTVDESFGVVRVGAYPGVRVYHENHLIDRTDENGEAFIPEMRAYERNRIRIAADDLPLEAGIEKLETVAVPGYRQGALVRFAAEPTQGALITIQRGDGRPLPAGATVRVVGADESFPVARKGQAWVTGLEKVTPLEARWDGHRCTFEVTLPEDPGPVPRLGPVTCRESP
jgi:outer membrane usher protein